MRGIQRTFGVSRPTLASWIKKRRNQSETWRHAFACWTWWYSRSRWDVVICLSKVEQTLDLDSYVPPNASNCGFCHRESQWSDLSQALGANPKRLQRLSKLQWLLESVSTCFPWENPSMCWKRKRADESYGTMVQHIQTIQCSLREKNVVLFKIRNHARNRNQAFHHSL